MLNTVAGRGVTVGLRRNHDYHDLYEPDPNGQAASGNARVWKVYLDDADVYDSDMVNSFRTILDSLLVFASLFSAVVTSFISQTSQILQPNDGKITSALLVETNRLLRAAGNITKIDTVPPSSLGLNSTSYTSRDVWVNGLFFTSLTLAVTTSLLTVLAKQWIQAYIEAVPGDAKTQAMVRQFRFDGLVKWNLKAIIEGLPLILHTSVAIFLVGLSLYVSQISHLICIVISIITALTFIFYIGTTMIPAFSIDCPYRLSSMFIVMRLIMIVALPVYYAFRHLVAIAIPCLSHWSIPRHKQRSPPLKTLKREESFYCVSEHTVWSCLSWLFGHSTNTSTKDIVVEGVCDVLNNQHNDWKPGVNIASFLRRVMGYSLHRAGKLQTISDIDDIIYSKSCWGTAISLILSMSLESLPMPRKEPSVDYYDLARDIFKRYSRAFHEKQSRIMINCLWFIKAFQLEDPINMFIFRWGDRDDFRCALAEVHDDMFLRPGGDITWLHRAAVHGNLEATMAILEKNPDLINRETKLLRQTALDYAISKPESSPSENAVRVIEYLLDHSATQVSHTLHFAVLHTRPDVIKLLLDKGWDRTTQNDIGETPIDVVRSMADHWPSELDDIINETFEYLENYQTVPLPHPTMLPALTSSNTSELLEDAETELEERITGARMGCIQTANNDPGYQIKVKKWKDISYDRVEGDNLV